MNKEKETETAAATSASSLAAVVVAGSSATGGSCTVEKMFLGFSEGDVVAAVMLDVVFGDILRKVNESIPSSEVSPAMSPPDPALPPESTSHPPSVSIEQSSRCLPDFMPKIREETMEEYVSRALGIAKSMSSSTKKQMLQKRSEVASTKSVVTMGYKQLLSCNRWKDREDSDVKILSPDDSRLTKRQKDIRRKIIQDSFTEQISPDQSRSGYLSSKSALEDNHISKNSTCSQVPCSTTKFCGYAVKQDMPGEISDLVSEIPSLIRRTYTEFMRQSGHPFDEELLQSSLQLPADSESADAIAEIIHSLYPSKKSVKEEPAPKKPIPVEPKSIKRTARKRTSSGCPCCVGSPGHTRTGSIEVLRHNRTEPSKIPAVANVLRISKTGLISPTKKALALELCKGCQRMRLTEKNDFVPKLKLCRRCSRPFQDWLDAPWNYVYTRCENGNCGVLNCEACWFWHCVDLVKKRLQTGPKLLDKATGIEEESMGDSFPLSKVAELCQDESGKVRYVCRRRSESSLLPFSEHKKRPWWCIGDFCLSALPPGEKMTIQRMEQSRYEDELPVWRPQKKVLSNGTTLVVKNNLAVANKPENYLDYKPEFRRSADGDSQTPFSSLGGFLSVRRRKRCISNDSSILALSLTLSHEPPKKKPKHHPSSRSKKSTQTNGKHDSQFRQESPGHPPQRVQEGLLREEVMACFIEGEYRDLAPEMEIDCKISPLLDAEDAEKVAEAVTDLKACDTSGTTETKVNECQMETDAEICDTVTQTAEERHGTMRQQAEEALDFSIQGEQEGRDPLRQEEGHHPSMQEEKEEEYDPSRQEKEEEYDPSRQEKEEAYDISRQEEKEKEHLSRQEEKEEKEELDKFRQEEEEEEYDLSRQEEKEKELHPSRQEEKQEEHHLSRQEEKEEEELDKFRQEEEEEEHGPSRQEENEEEYDSTFRQQQEEQTAGKQSSPEADEEQNVDQQRRETYEIGAQLGECGPLEREMHDEPVDGIISDQDIIDEWSKWDEKLGMNVSVVIERIQLEESRQEERSTISQTVDLDSWTRSDGNAFHCFSSPRSSGYWRSLVQSGEKLTSEEREEAETDSRKENLELDGCDKIPAPVHSMGSLMFAGMA